MEIENWVETKLSCLTCSCVHTADAYKTRQSVRVGGVNKLLDCTYNGKLLQEIAESRDRLTLVVTTGFFHCGLDAFYRQLS